MAGQHYVVRDVRTMYSNSAGEGGGGRLPFFGRHSRIFFTKMAEILYGDSLAKVNI